MIINKKSQSNLERAASPPFTAEYNYATKSPLVTMGCPIFSPQMPIPFDDLHLHLIHQSFERRHSPSQTASGSNQPFCHNSSTTQVDRQTDGIGDKTLLQHSLTLH